MNGLLWCSFGFLFSLWQYWRRGPVDSFKSYPSASIMVVSTRHQATWEGGVGTFFQGQGYMVTPWWVPVALRLLWTVLLYKKGSADSSASGKLSAWHSLQSWVAACCWHVQFWTMKQIKKKSNLPGMLSSAKIADAQNEKVHHTSGAWEPSGSYWKKHEYFSNKSALSHFRCLPWNPSISTSRTLTARLETIP